MNIQTEKRNVAEVDAEILRLQEREAAIDQERSEFRSQIEALEVEHGRLYAHGGNPAPVEDEIAALERKDRGAERGLVSVRESLLPLRSEREQLRRAEATAAREATEAEAEAILADMRAKVLAFAAEILEEKRQRLDPALTAIAKANREASIAGAKHNPYAGSQLFTRHAPIGPLLADLESLVKGKLVSAAFVKRDAPEIVSASDIGEPTPPEPAERSLAFA